MDKEKWFFIENINSLNSPSLVFYIDRIKHNIVTLIKMIDNKDLLRPHVKTHKTIGLTKLLQEKGINKFKCSTISEAEMLGYCGTADVLLAYQPVGPNIGRIMDLHMRFPNTTFSCLIDHENIAAQISEEALKIGIVQNVYLDLNVGMNRTGVKPKDGITLYKHIKTLKGLRFIGIHAYDGHISDNSLRVRKEECDKILGVIRNIQKRIIILEGQQIRIISGGTPTFSIYAKYDDVECSPGTFALWDKGYKDLYKEQLFQEAALIITRIISLPSDNLVCVDLGYKAIAAENELNRRVYFLNAPELIPVSQNEEHLVLKTAKGHSYKIGDILYALPIHICPSVALYDEATIISAGLITDKWNIVSRRRKITV